MKWDLQTIDRYLEAKEYIDTAVIPISSIDLGENCKEGLTQLQTLLQTTQLVEEQLQGRVMLFPLYTDVGQADQNIRYQLLQTYTEELKQNGFPHVLWVGFSRDKLLWAGASDDLFFVFLEDFISLEKEAQGNDLRQLADKIQHEIMNLWKKDKM